MRTTPLALALAVLALLPLTAAAAEETPRMGGVLKVATIGEPPTLDIAMSTATQVYEIMWHVSESLAIAGLGFKEFYRLDPGLFFPEQPWHSTASAALYDQKSPDKARRLLQEAGYARQPVRWMTNTEYDFMYKNALVAKQQLEAAGFVVDLQVMDWATQNQRMEKPELWDVFSTGFVFSADPALHVALRCTFAGWWCNEEKERLMADLRTESDARKRKAIIERLQTVFYEDVGSVKLADYFTLDAARRELRGPFRTAPRMYFWNSWLAR